MTILECVTMVALHGAHPPVAAATCQGYQPSVGSVALEVVDKAAVPAPQKHPASAASNDVSVPFAGTIAAEASAAVFQDQDLHLSPTFYSFSWVLPVQEEACLCSYF